jgi:1,4-alpha-glucan branching enzyme
LQQFVGDVNKLYLAEAALWQSDYDMAGFAWIDCSDHENCVLAFLRQDAGRTSELVVILNLTPAPRHNYRFGLPRPGHWSEVLNSDAAVYGGSNAGNLGGVVAEDVPWQNQSCSANFTLPPLSVIVFRPERGAS